jgi:two-component system sensor histidine kinase AlgZ
MPWQWEHEFTRMYVALQTLRFADKLEVTFDIQGVPPGTPFPVLLLQPLIENAIHHGPLVDGQACRVDVRLRHADGRVRLQVGNLLARGVAPASSGLGISNIEARLRALYGDRFHFSHGPVQGRFEVRAEFPDTVDTTVGAPT